MSDKAIKIGIAVWFAAFVLGISFTGVIVWAIIRLVNHYT